MVTVIFYAPWSQRVDPAHRFGPKTVLFPADPGGTLRQLLRQLAREYPSLGPVCDPDAGRPESHLAIIVNGKVVGSAGYDLKLEEGAEITLLPSYAGG